MSLPINHNTVNEQANGSTRGLSNKDPHYNSAGNNIQFHKPGNVIPTKDIFQTRSG